jgi:hypothetical protein
MACIKGINYNHFFKKKAQWALLRWIEGLWVRGARGARGITKSNSYSSRAIRATLSAINLHASRESSELIAARAWAF